MDSRTTGGRAPSLFILCPIRSFSSIICAMLGQHPEMYGFPELRLFNADTVGGTLRYHEDVVRGADTSSARSRDPVLYDHVQFFRPHEQGQGPARFSDGLLRALAELHFGGQTVEGVRQAEAWLRARTDRGVEEVFDLLLSHIAPRIGVDKSPHTGKSPQAMERVLRLYPHARFLHLTRHPITTVKSMWQFFQPAFRQARPGGDPGDLARHCAYLWHATHQGIVEFTAALPPGQTLRLRGEDALRDPDAQLASIARWLGVRADHEAVEAMKHPEASPYATPGPENAPFGNDPTFLAKPHFKPVEAPSLPQAPGEWTLGADLQRKIFELANQLGYKRPEGRTGV